MRGFLLLFFLWLPWISVAQTITVINQNTRQPIPFVLIYDQDKINSVTTDLEGKANIADFPKDARIILQHPSYISSSITISNISSINYIIQLKENIISMKEVLVSASKWEQDRSEIPNQILSVSSYDIEFQNPQTAADILDKSGQVFVQKSQLGGGSPMIRGFAANSVLIVVEGVRMNNAIFRSGNLQNVINIDPNILGGAEVLFGPGSVIYGSDALGGVMDFHFQEPRFNSNDSIKVQGNALSRYSSANNEWTGHVDFNIYNSKFSSLTSFSYSNFDDLRAGANRPDKFPDFGKRPFYVKTINGTDQIIANSNENLQIPSGYSVWNVLQKLSYRAKPTLKLGFTLNYSTTTDIPRYDRLIETSDNGDPRFAEWYYGPQEWLYTTLRADFQGNSWFDQGKLILGYQFFEESRNDRRFNNVNFRSRTEMVNAYSLNLDLEKEVGSHSTLYYGLEFIHNTIKSNAFSRDVSNGDESIASTRYPDGGSDYGSVAAYLSYKRSFSTRTHLTTGVRYSYVYLESIFEDTTFFDFPFNELSISNGAINGSLGITHDLGSKWQWNGLISSGFRAPNLDDIGKVFDSEPGVVIVPNPELEPEYSYNFETSIGKNIRDHTRIDAVIFYSILRDAMVRRPFTFNGQDSIIYDGSPSRVEALVNVGKAYVFGWSVSFRSQLSPSWSLNGAITYADGRDKTEDIPLRHTTPVFGNLGLTWNSGKFKAEGMMRFNGKREFDDLPPSEQNKEHLYTEDGALAWYTLNANFSYTPNNHWKFTTGIENILDKHYRPYSSGISAPGFNWIIGVSARF